MRGSAQDAAPPDPCETMKTALATDATGGGRISDMMKTLRKGVSGWMAKLLLGLVVIAFVITGFSGFFTGTAPNTVLSAGGTDILVEDYRLAYRQAEVQLGNQLGRQPTREEAAAQGIDSRVMSQLVAEAVLDEQGRTAGLGLSEESLAKVIAEDPTFHDASGRFSRGNFANLLANIGMTQNDFIRNREQAAVRSQIVEAVSSGAGTPSTVIDAFGLYNGESRSIDFLTLPVTSVEPVPEPSAEALQTYFDANKAVYRAPEYRGIAYATLTAEAIADPSAITDAAIAEDYERNRAQFTTPERRQIEQIVYPDKAAADAAKAALDGGKLFEQLIIESGRTVADTQLGLLAKPEIPDTVIANAAFALASGTVSAVVEGTFGPVLLRVTEIEPEVVRPLDEVRDEIRSELALASAAPELQRVYDSIDDARAGGATLDEAAKSAGLPIQTVASISANGDAPDGTAVADIPAGQDLLEAAFQAEVGFETIPLQLQAPENGYVFYEVTKIDPARDRTLDEVRARVVTDWKAAEAERLLTERAEALKARRDGGETLDAIAAAEGLTKETAPAVTRITGAAQLGQTGIRAAFSGPNGFVTTSTAMDGTSKLLIEVTEVAAPMDAASNLGQNEREQLNGMIETDLLQSYIGLLQNEYEVVRYPAAVQAAQNVGP